MRLTVVSAAILSMVALSACTDNNQYDTQTEIVSPTDKLSYTIGVDLGSNFRDQDIEVDTVLVKQGMDDVINGRELRLTQEQMDSTLTQFQEEILAKRAEEITEIAGQNQLEGAAFLAEAKMNDNVSELPSGLLYEVITEGSGPLPSIDDTVTVTYEGLLIDGTVIDSSLDEPVTLTLNQLIPGWQEALTHMPAGSIWKIYLPSELAYGEQGAGMIGPNQVLVFEIHLLSVNSRDESEEDANNSTTTDDMSPASDNEVEVEVIVPAG